MSGLRIEFVVEHAALVWFESLGYTVPHNPDIAAGDPGAESILKDAP